MSLKSDMAVDISEVFLNTEDFGDVHVVDGNEIVAVFYDEEIQPNDPEFGLVSKKWTLQASSADMPPPRKPGATLEIDDRVNLVETWREELGMSVVSLSENC